MDKSKYAKFALLIFGMYIALSTIAVMCVSFYNDIKVFQFGFKMGGALLIVYPVIGGITYIVVSLIGIIKSKKVLPYIICPVISFFVWLILGGAMAVYV